MFLEEKWERVIHPLELLPLRRELAPEHMAIIKGPLEGWDYVEIENKKNDNKPRRNLPRLCPWECALKRRQDEFT